MSIFYKYKFLIVLHLNVKVHSYYNLPKKKKNLKIVMR